MKHAITVTIQARITPKLKRSAEAIFKSVGLSTSDAIRVFLQQSVNAGAIPFPLVPKIPSTGTIKAMQELDEGDYEEFKDTKALFKAWRKPSAC